MYDLIAPDILATFVEGEPVQISGRSTRFGNAMFLDAAEAEGVQAVHDAGLVRLHGTADSGWPTQTWEVD